MALTNFKPAIWAARAAHYLDRALVFASPDVVNRDYEGEIAVKGDSVNINQIGDITVSDYTSGTDISSPQQLTDAQLKLIIDQAKYINFEVDDIDKAQVNMNTVDMAMERGSYAFRKVVDTDIATVMSDGVDTANVIGTMGSPISITTGDLAYQYLVELTTKLDEANVPENGRFAIVPPWYYNLLLRNTAFVAAGTTMTDNRLITGVISQVLGMKVMKSNAIVNTSGTKYKIMAGVNLATTVATQIPVGSMISYRPEKRFSTAIKALLLYGRKVTHPTALAMLIANKT